MSLFSSCLLGQSDCICYDQWLWFYAKIFNELISIANFGHSVSVDSVSVMHIAVYVI